MYKSVSALKREAREVLKGRWGKALSINIVPIVLVSMITVVGTFIVLILFSILFAGIASEGEYANVFQLILVLILMILIFVAIPVVNAIIWMLNLSAIRLAYLDMYRNPDQPNSCIATLDQLKGSRWGKYTVLNIVMSVFIALWTMLLYIPGIIKTYSYSQSLYVLKDSMDEDAQYYGETTESITISRQLMNGHKGRLFLLQLSFFGWAILASFTCGIGYFFLQPYMELSLAAFYQDLIDKQSDQYSNTAIDINNR